MGTIKRKFKLAKMLKSSSSKKEGESTEGKLRTFIKKEAKSRVTKILLRKALLSLAISVAPYLIPIVLVIGAITAGIYAIRSIFTSP